MAEPTKLDKAIEVVLPGWAAKRQEARARISAGKAWEQYGEQVRRYAGRGGPSASYSGGVTTRVDAPVDYTDFKSSGIRDLSGTRIDIMRRRARRLTQNNNLASALVNASVNFVIGGGTRIEPMTGDKAFNTAAQELWDNYWFCRNGGSPDVRGMSSGPELERMLFAARIRDGDAGVILLDDGRIQAIEGDLIETPDKLSGGFKVSEGVEINNVGRPTGFWLRTIDETNPFLRKWERVDADNFCFFPRLKRINQLRGETAFAQSFTLFEQLEGYVDGVVMAARMAAMFGLLIREPVTAGFAGLPTGTDSRGMNRPMFDMEAAMVKRLNPGDEVIQVKPEQPTTQFEQFVVSLVRMAGLELSLPLELALLDFSKTTYSSARAAMIVAQRAACAEHHCWCLQFISRVYRWRVSKWIKSGELKEPSDGLPWKHRPIQEPYEYLNPVQDVQGDMLEIDAGLTTLGEKLIARGTTLDEFIAKRSDEITKLDAAGIELSKSSMTRDELPQNQQTNNANTAANTTYGQPSGGA